MYSFSLLLLLLLPVSGEFNYQAYYKEGSTCGTVDDLIVARVSRDIANCAPNRSCEEYLVANGDYLRQEFRCNAAGYPRLKEGYILATVYSGTNCSGTPRYYYTIRNGLCDSLSGLKYLCQPEINITWVQFNPGCSFNDGWNFENPTYKYQINTCLSTRYSTFTNRGSSFRVDCSATFELADHAQTASTSSTSSNGVAAAVVGLILLLLV